MGIFFGFQAITPKISVLGIQKGSRTSIIFENKTFSLSKKFYTGFLKGFPYKSSVFGPNWFSGIHLRLYCVNHLCELQLFFGRHYFLHTWKPCILSFSTTSHTNFWKKPVFYHYCENTGLWVYINVTDLTYFSVTKIWKCIVDLCWCVLTSNIHCLKDHTFGYNPRLYRFF